MQTKFYDRQQNKVKADLVLQKLKPAKKKKLHFEH